MDISYPTISNVAYFLIYLFKEKNLKPSINVGYRTAISDRLGLNGEEICKGSSRIDS